MNKLQVKSFLLPASTELVITSAKSSNIRMFAIDYKDYDELFDKLISMIQRLYGNLVPSRKDEIRTYWWINQVKDLIQFSTSFELENAINWHRTAENNVDYERKYEHTMGFLFNVYVLAKKEEVKANKENVVGINSACQDIYMDVAYFENKQIR